EKGIYSFTSHEEKSYDIIKNWPFISDWTKDIVRYHFIILDMKRKKNKEEEKYQDLKNIWNTFDDSFQQDLQIFLKYDSFGKV
ncbi:MAG: phosphohydrolase, partial [Campylobacteraceae bacterium]|nr:phosphohydrolase [Campylobacteraceae bacterium]